MGPAYLQAAWPSQKNNNRKPSRGEVGQGQLENLRGGGQASLAGWVWLPSRRSAELHRTRPWTGSGHRELPAHRHGEWGRLLLSTSDPGVCPRAGLLAAPPEEWDRGASRGRTRSPLGSGQGWGRFGQWWGRGHKWTSQG